MPEMWQSSVEGWNLQNVQEQTVLLQSWEESCSTNGGNGRGKGRLGESG
jgi:hypothetical protein